MDEHDDEAIVDEGEELAQESVYPLLLEGTTVNRTSYLK